MITEIKHIFNKPCIIGVVGNVNSGKSLLLYHLIDELQKFEFSLFTFGLRNNIKQAKSIYSLAEIEQIQNSIIIIDEFTNLFDLDNRKNKRQIENSLRLINHNNNILFLCGVPENFKKFICGKLDYIFFKKTTKSDLINGARAKNILNDYKGYEMGTEMLNISPNLTIFWDGLHYHKMMIPYIKKYDTKKDNVSILQKKKPKIKQKRKTKN